jgi:hypothetical protein
LTGLYRIAGKASEMQLKGVELMKQGEYLDAFTDLAIRVPMYSTLGILYLWFVHIGYKGVTEGTNYFTRGFNKKPKY